MDTEYIVGSVEKVIDVWRAISFILSRPGSNSYFSTSL